MTHHEHKPDEETIAAGAVSNVMQYLDGLDFPTTRLDVQRVAKENGADSSAMEEIERLPEDRTFKDPVDLSAWIGREVEGL